MKSALLLICPALLFAQSHTTFYAAYQDALEYERAGQWREALLAYQRAIVLRPRPAAKVVIYGNNLLLDYYPYARSVRCQLELGQTEAARLLLARSEGAGEPEAARSALRARLVQPKAPNPPAEHPLALPASPNPQPQTIEVPPPKITEPVPAEKPPPSTPKSLELPKPTPKRDPELPSKSTPSELQEPPKEAPSQVQIASTPQPPPESHNGRIPGWAAGLGFGFFGLLLLWVLLKRLRPAKQPTGYRDPEQVGPFRIDRLLGRGGFASTYLARHSGSGQQVALKVLHPFRQEDTEFVSRFRQEAQLGTLLDHPNIVRMLDTGPEDSMPWLAMEYVFGERLDQRLRSMGSLPIAEAIRLGNEIASAMAHAHAHGVIHRDLKPSNVMLAEGRAKVMDFGISRRMDAETLTTTYAFLGTPLYAAPEAQLKTQVGPASDRYALGIMLFEMLAGRTPYSGETPFEILDKHRSMPLPDLAALRPETPEPLLRLVEQLCQKEPAQRLEDAEVIKILVDLARTT